jgi:amidohydrolase
MAITRWRGLVLLAAFSLGWASSAGVSSAVGAEPLATFVEQELPASLALYKHFHTHPELSHQEFKTAERLAAELKAAGCEVTTGVGGTGVVALIRNGDGPVVMVRGDMDALPVTEQTGVAYASTVQAKDRTGNPTGVMHACGHDIHTTLLVGVARYFVQTKANWKGTLMLIGQPAEEVSGGASGMLKDGLFTRFPKPTYAIAPHVDARLEAGKIGYRAGYALANVDSVDVTLYGKGGHGAYPQGTIDPIVMAARFVLDLQTIISRENPPLEPAVITVGAIHAGTKHNIISDRCHLQITVRSYSPEVRDKLLKAIERKAKATADSAGAKAPKVEFSDYTPALKNDEALVERLVPVFAGAIGADHVQKADQSLGGEDFSEFGLAGVPVFQFRLGSVATDRLKQFKTAGEEPPSLHSPFYFPDPEPTLRTGLTALIAACEDLFSARSK